jgi:hypothetical protein
MIQLHVDCNKLIALRCNRSSPSWRLTLFERVDRWPSVTAITGGTKGEESPRLFFTSLRFVRQQHVVSYPVISRLSKQHTHCCSVYSYHEKNTRPLFRHTSWRSTTVSDLNSTYISPIHQHPPKEYYNKQGFTAQFLISPVVSVSHTYRTINYTVLHVQTIHDKAVLWLPG